ncbi:MAG: T9SS type A sorting domain-containing protein [Bacteroidales bacterium]|nr:T9SS type A sorting domain-containing protein [Bacteroidales bacterium]
MKKKSNAQAGMSKFWMVIMMIILLPASYLTAQNVLVTFRVNMSEAYPTNGVYIGSDWAGWSLEKFQQLTDANNDSVFELTIYLQAGNSYNYRYTRSKTNWNNFESLAGTLCGFGPNHEDRNIIVPQSNTVLDIVCFDDCLDCGSHQSTDLNLSVDMTGLTVSPNGVHVTGSFNNWITDSLQLTDADNDKIYEISVSVLPKLDYEYKFLNGNTLEDAEVVFGTCEFRSNRRISLGEESLTVPVVKFGSCNESGSPISDIKIACIGNSITEGGAGNYMNSWPIQLRDMLGNGYYTENLGVAGTTMSKAGDSPWWNEPQYDYTFSLNPDIVLIKLGTNDSKASNWKPANFMTDYIELIQELRALPSNPTIYMVTPAKAYSSAWGINDNTIVSQVIPYIHLIAFENAVNVIDMYNATSMMSSNFPDGIHPNAEGAKVIAQKAKQNLINAKPMITQVDITSDSTENPLYHWYYNDTPIDGSNFRSINVSESGKYKVSVKMSNVSSDIYVSDPFDVVLPQGTATVGLTVDYDVVNKVNNTYGLQNILIYPNPASSTIKIENASNTDVTMFNDLGTIVLTQRKINGDQTINLPGLKNGVYFIRLTKENSSVTQRIVVLKD